MNRPNFIIQTGSLRPAGTEEHIKWCVQSLLSMQQGEVPRYPDLGTDLMPLMFRRDTPKLREEIKSRIESALKKWEPRIALEEIHVTLDPSSPELLAVNLRYRILESQRVDSVRIYL